MSQSSQILRILVYSFHMPLFFLISGYLNKENRTLQKLKKDAFSLIRPAYIILGIDVFISIFQCVLGMDPWPDRKVIFETIILYKGLWKNFPIWFLMTLFVCKSLVTLFGSKWCRIIALICAGCCILNLNGNLPAFWLFTTISAMPFFTFGMSMRDKDNLEVGKNEMVVISGLWIAIALFNGPVDMYQQDNGKAWILFAITGVLGTYVTICISKWIEKKKSRVNLLLSTIGKNTIAILLTHYYLCRIIIPKALQVIHHKEIYNSVVFQIFITSVLIEIYFYLFKRRRKSAQ